MLKKLLITALFLFLPVYSVAGELSPFMIEPPLEAKDTRFLDARKRILSISDFKGKVILLNFWATWCLPCVKEMPMFNRLSSEFSNEGLEIIPLSLDYQGVQIVNEYYTKFGLSQLGIYLDQEKVAFRDYQVDALPTTYIIDREGKVRARVLGEIAWESDEVKGYIRGLLGISG